MLLGRRAGTGAVPHTDEPGDIELGRINRPPVRKRQGGSPANTGPGITTLPVGEARAVVALNAPGLTFEQRFAPPCLFGKFPVGEPVRIWRRLDAQHESFQGLQVSFGKRAATHSQRDSGAAFVGPYFRGFPLPAERSSPRDTPEALDVFDDPEPVVFEVSAQASRVAFRMATGTGNCL